MIVEFHVGRDFLMVLTADSRLPRLQRGVSQANNTHIFQRLSAAPEAKDGQNKKGLKLVG